MRHAVRLEEALFRGVVFVCSLGNTIISEKLQSGFRKPK